MLDYGEQRDLNNEQKKYSLWVFMDTHQEVGMRAISPDVVSVEYFELKELKVGVAL